jgi:hypothetical protein
VGLPHAETAPKIDFRAITDVGTNAFLAVRRLERGFITINQIQERFPRMALLRAGLAEVTEPEQPPEGGTAASVDWRNRWGGNWITSVRDQDGCNACWAFAGLALIEAMVKVEDAIWTRLSEGDIHCGIGAKCADYGNITNVSNFFSANGVCDPACFPWATNNPPTPLRPTAAGALSAARV